MAGTLLDFNYLKHDREPFYFTGSASGKTSVCKCIMDELKNHRVAIVCLDSFYLPLTSEQLKFVSDYNFDHPDAWDWNLLLS
jgi:uridine kinase